MNHFSIAGSVRGADSRGPDPIGRIGSGQNIVQIRPLTALGRPSKASVY